jgi:2-polyprenyl-3-methyl-5-hydroxy-6-metoxy-1,4-benzoquinol methylase
VTAGHAGDEAVRFAFGANWTRFLRTLNDDRILQAEASIQQMLGRQSLAGSRVLDIGCGSGLFSLAARRLGAEVVSFDFDPLSVSCALEMKRRYFPDDPRWRIERGSVLDEDYVRSLGQFDIVYSWGVLHHTGAMWHAIELTCAAVRPGGLLFIAIYNDQGRRSVWWTRVKRTYNVLPRVLRTPYLMAFAVALELGAVVVYVGRLQPQRLIQRWTHYESVRGMSRWHDIVDWVGGYPFEVATPDAVRDFCSARGFTLARERTCGRRMGCNEFLFTSGIGR